MNIENERRYLETLENYFLKKEAQYLKEISELKAKLRRSEGIKPVKEKISAEYEIFKLDSTGFVHYGFLSVSKDYLWRR